jgi:hypothetical protein
MKRSVLILAFLMGPLLLAADFVGTYKGEQLSVTLAIENGQYSGVIHSAGQKYPCTARSVGDELRGTFMSGDDKFQFTATLRGNTLTLVTGDTTYQLQKQKPAAQNPLAKSAVANPAPANRPAAPQSGVLRLKKVSIQDHANMIGGEAFTFLAPVDWQVDGGLVWRAHPTMPAAAALRVRNPENIEQLECFPTVAFSWGGYLTMTGFPQGSNYLGNEVQPPARDAIAYLKERHVRRARSGIPARFIGEEELPKLAEAARAAEPAPEFGGPQMQFTAGRVRVEYEMNGKPVEEDFYCVLNTMLLPQSKLTLQIADKLYALRAERGGLSNLTKIGETMIHSTRPNLQWFNKYAQLVQSLTQMQMQRIQAAGEISRIISRTSNEISDMMMKSYEERQASQDRINKNWSQYMRGVDEYRDPVAGRPVELPSGYNNAWVNSAGEYIVTDSALYNPNVEIGGNWQKLERK